MPASAALELDFHTVVALHRQKTGQIQVVGHMIAAVVHMLVGLVHMLVGLVHNLAVPVRMLVVVVRIVAVIGHIAAFVHIVVAAEAGHIAVAVVDRKDSAHKEIGGSVVDKGSVVDMNSVVDMKLAVQQVCLGGYGVLQCRDMPGMDDRT